MKELFEHNLELEHSFWCTSRNQLLLQWIKTGPVLDVGSGVGAMTRLLLDGGMETYSIDIDEKSCEKVSEFNPNTFCIDITKIDIKKFPKFKTIIVLDVIEHIKDDNKAINKISQLLDEEGRVIISVPYHPYLWNKTDKYHFRRYSKKSLKQLLESNGLIVNKFRLWNMVSLGPLIVSKLFNFELSHQKIAHSWLNNILRGCFIQFENRIPFPLGSQLFCIAEKRAYN